VSVRSRQRGQAIVEFGIIALLFTLLMFAIVDFGLLLNSWVRLSAGTREVARAAAVGYTHDQVQTMVQQLTLPGINPQVNHADFVQYCCGDHSENDALVLQITYYDHLANCIPGASGCNPLDPHLVDNNYWGGACPSGCNTGPNAHPARGDIIVVSLQAPGMQIFTPLVRPFFGCNGNQVNCYVHLGSSTMMRYEGQ